MTLFFTLEEVAQHSDVFDFDLPTAAKRGYRITVPGARSSNKLSPRVTSSAAILSLKRIGNSKTGQRRGHFRTLKGKMSFVRSAALKKQSLNRELMAKKKLRATALVAAKKLGGKAAVVGVSLLAAGSVASYLSRRREQ